jgi:hypothetical protein
MPSPRATTRRSPALPRGPLALPLVCCALACAAVGAPPALASHTQSDFFEGGQVLLEARHRERALAQMVHLGVRALRVELYWSDVAPGAASRRRPSFDATNPAAYHWGAYDWLLAKAQELRWPVLLTVTAPVPRWASAAGTPFTRPDDRDFQEFMTAVGHHYGSQVALFAVWNEPNDVAFLQPQFNANGTPASPRIYRGLFQAGYAGLQAAGLAHPKVLMGETAPVGFDTLTPSYIRLTGGVRHGGLLHDVAPLRFLRETLCLDAHYHRTGSCEALPAYGYSTHAYTQRQGPRWVPPEYDDVTIGVLSRLERALDAAARAGAIRSGLPLYLTEFGVQSKPNRYLGVSPAKQAEEDALAEYIAWRDPRVAGFSQYLLRDDRLGGAPGAGVHGGRVGFQTGLEYVNGTPKPLYYSWPVPLVVSRAGRGYALWGLVRPAAGATQVTVLVRARGSRRYRVLRTAATDSLGYWSFTSPVAGAAWKVRWTSPAGVRYEGPPIGP